MHADNSPSTSADLLTRLMKSEKNGENLQASSYGKTSPVCCPTKQGRLAASLPVLSERMYRLSRQGENGRTRVMCLVPKEILRGPSLTHNFSDWRSDAVVCGLSQVLETGSIPQQYYLSQKACAGILRRAEKRGKELPIALKQALESGAHPCPLPERGNGPCQTAESFGEAVSSGRDLARCLHTNEGVNLDSETSTLIAQKAVCVTGDITHALKAEGADASGDGTGRGNPIVAVKTHRATSAEQIIAFHAQAQPDEMRFDPHTSAALTCSQNSAVAIHENPRSELTLNDTAGAIKCGGGKPAAMGSLRVRRLTPEECETLMGFPNGYTKIPWKKKPADECPDGPRYKALGNSWAVPVAAWVGKRVQMSLDSLRCMNH